jgi:histidinol dehydrogenase
MGEVIVKVEDDIKRREEHLVESNKWGKQTLSNAKSLQ